jgi:hypothetical protein
MTQENVETSDVERALDKHLAARLASSSSRG